MELFLNYLTTFFINAFELYIIYRYMTIFFENRCIDTRLMYIAYAARFFLSVGISYIELYSLVSAAIALSSIFLISLCYSGSLPKRLIISVLIYMCSFTAEVIVAMAVGLSSFDAFGKVEQGSVFLNLIIEFIFWLISLIVHKFKNLRGNLPIPKPFLIAIVVIPSSLICLEIIIFSQKILNNMMARISLVCLTASLFILIYLYDSLSAMFRERTEAAVTLSEKEYYHQQSVLLNEKYEELRQYRHDMKNRMVVMQQMIKENQYDKVLEYTGEIADKLSQTLTYSNTGNVALDSVINYKLTRAAKSNILVESNVVIPEDISLDEDDMIVILGNLLDNAIEAVNRIETDVKKYIYMDIDFEMGSLWICIKNSYDNKLYVQENRFVTWKKDKTMHGIGLQSTESIVQKYNGLMEFSMEENLFVVDILLYL